MSVAPTKQVNRLHFIDSLRGFAALYVIMFHMVLVPSPKLMIPAWLHPFIYNGGTGVTLFFVVSAFTLCFTLEARQGEPKRTASFYLRRVFRIVPLYYVWLTVMAFTEWGWGTWHHKTLLLFTTFSYNFVPSCQEGLVWASWTLGVEMVFYLFFPLLFSIVKTATRAWLFVIFSLFISALHFKCVQWSGLPPGTQEKVTKFSIFHQLPVFAVGMLAYFLYKRLMEKERPNRRLFAWLLGLGTAGVVLLPYIPKALDIFPSIYLMAVAYTLLLLGLSGMPTFVIVNRVTIFFGTISYSLYLNHPLLIYNCSRVYSFIYSHRANLLLKLAACYGLTLIMVTVLSCLTYMLIEQPGIKLGSQLIRRLKAAPRASASPKLEPVA
jgi:peptidoglycan/LPS O-acetylase OafA/YrhL